jgi:hypothetical protein
MPQHRTLLASLQHRPQAFFDRRLFCTFCFFSCNVFFSRYEEVMVKCWAADPKRRPGFSDLEHTLVALGAVKNVGADEEPGLRAPTKKRLSFSGEARRMTGSNDRKLCGLSVHHINNVLLPNVLSVVRPPWATKHGESVDPPESATISHAVDAVGKPAGAKQQCPRDGKMGCAYVDTLHGADHVGQSTALLSCE